MESPEETQLREHVRELRLAARGIGRDLRIEFSNVDEKIARLGRMTRKEAKYALRDIEDDLADLGAKIADDARRLPGAVQAGAIRTGAAIGRGVTGAAAATRDAIVGAGKTTKRVTKDSLAKMAGVNRKPIREWKNQNP